MDDRLIRIQEVMRRTTYGRSTIWELIKQKKFPEPIKLSPRISVWPDRQIATFIKSGGKEW